MDPLAAACFAIVGLASALAFLLGRRTRRGWIPCAVSALLLISLCVVLQKRPELEWRFCPHRLWAILEQVAFFPFMFWFFGIAFPRIPRKSTRTAIAVFLALVSCIGLVYVYARLALTDFRNLEGEWDHGVCTQATQYTCAGAAMATALSRRGIPATEGEMATLADTLPIYGTNDFHVACALERKLAGLPFRVELRKMTWEELRASPVPAVVSMEWSSFVGHMSVVLGFEGEGAHETVALGDPAKLFYVLRKSDFEKRWYGYAILILPTR